MKLLVYKFNKRHNSTKVPNIEGTELDVRLKDNTSIHSPSFLLTNVSLNEYNYLKWQDRYYFINEQIQIKNELIEIECSMDYLATFKNDILNTSAFITYSASNYDSFIPDNRLSTNAEATISVNKALIDPGVGGYFVTYIGNGGKNSGYIAYNQLPNLINVLNTDGLYDAILKDPTDYLSKKFNSVTDCVIECHWLPLIPGFDGTSGTLVLGRNYDTGIPIRGVAHNKVVEYDINIPWQFSDFRNRSPYTSLLLYLPGYGLTALNTDDFIGESSIHIKTSYDGYDGGLTYLVDDKFRYTTNVATNIMISTNNVGNVVTSVASMAGGIASMASGNYLAGTAGLFNAVFNQMGRDLGTVGANGGSSGFNVSQYIQLFTVSHNTTIEPNSMLSTNGRPLNQVRKIDGLSGYCETTNISVTTNDVVANDTINALMNGGVYIE